MKKILIVVVMLALSFALFGQDQAAARSSWGYKEWEMYDRSQQIAYLFAVIDTWKFMYNVSLNFDGLDNFQEFMSSSWSYAIEGKSTQFLAAVVDEFYLKPENREKPVIYALFMGTR